MKKTKHIVSLLLSVILLLSIIFISPATTSAATYEASKVVNLALSKVGTSYANGYCLSFVKSMFSEAYGFTSTTCCAYKYGNSYIDSTSRNNIPLGASVFFAGSTITCNTCGNKCGHIGIYVGDNYIVHGWSGKIVKTTIDYVINCGYPYRGWGWHGNVALTNTPSTSTVTPAAPGTRTVSDGEYHIVTAINTSQGLDVYQANTANGTNVSVYPNVTDSRQVFNVKYLGDGYYSIIHRLSGRALDCQNGGTSPRTNVQIYDQNNTDAQKWVIKTTGDGETFYIISKKSGLYLDVLGGTVHDYSTNVQIYTSNSSIAQKWMFIATGDSVGQTIADGEYHITTALDESQGLDLYGANTANGTNVSVYPNVTDSRQVFNVEYLGDGYYSIISRLANKSLDCAGRQTVSRTNVQIWDYADVDHHKWIIKESPSEGYYYIISKKSGLYLDVLGGTVHDYSTNVQLYLGNGSKAQLWKFVKANEYEYKVLDDGTIEITNFTGTDAELIIPAKIDGYTVTKIGEEAFANCTSFSKVTIPDSVTSIGYGAFAYCYNLTDIDIPDSVTNIGSEAFYYCKKLTIITIPENIVSIKDYTFMNCESLLEVVFPNSVTSIGKDAFGYCESLRNIVLPSSLTSIGDRAFGFCSSLTELTMPDNLTYLDARAFVNCENLKSVTLNNKLIGIGEFAFFNCPNIVNIKIPQSVKSIGEYALGYYSDPNLDYYLVDIFFISGYTSTIAEMYAKENNIAFKSLGEVVITNVKGDTDGDGSVTIIDATQLQLFLAEIISQDRIVISLADTDGDGSATVIDTTRIQMFLANLIDSLD